MFGTSRLNMCKNTLDNFVGKLSWFHVSLYRGSFFEEYLEKKYCPMYPSKFLTLIIKFLSSASFLHPFPFRPPPRRTSSASSSSQWSSPDLHCQLICQPLITEHLAGPYLAVLIAIRTTTCYRPIAVGVPGLQPARV